MMCCVLSLSLSLTRYIDFNTELNSIGLILCKRFAGCLTVALHVDDNCVRYNQQKHFDLGEDFKLIKYKSLYLIFFGLSVISRQRVGQKRAKFCLFHITFC
jgi:hypothetical protein